MSLNFKSFRTLALVLGNLFLVVVFVGCGGGKSSVTGKVTTKGEPVKGGSLTFAPISAASGTGDKAVPARPAVGKVKDDGTFVMGTDKESDGAPPGKYTVLYSPPTVEWNAPDWDGKGTAPQAPKSGYEDLVPKEAEVEVKAGKNEINIELVPKT